MDARRDRRTKNTTRRWAVEQRGQPGAAGLFATLVVVLVRTMAAPLAAGLLGLTVMAPTVLLFFIPLPKKKRRGARETFSHFFGDLYRVCRRPGASWG